MEDLVTESETPIKDSCAPAPLDTKATCVKQVILVRVSLNVLMVEIMMNWCGTITPTVYQSLIGPIKIDLVLYAMEATVNGKIPHTHED